MNYKKLLYLVVTFLLSGIELLFPNTNYYVDKNANGTNNGSSWDNAWVSFNDINWNIIQPGDTIFISGGADSLVYEEMIDVPKYKSGTGGNPITITRATDPGHDGVVILDGINLPELPAVRVDRSSYITVNGLKTIRWLSYPSNLGTFDVFGSDHIIIENNIMEAWSQGLKISESNNCIFRNNRYTTPEYIENQTDGIYAYLNYDNIYEGNYINISNGSPDDHNDCFQGQTEGPCIIRNNIIMHSGPSALKPIQSQGLFDKYTNGLHQYINNLIYLPNKSTPQQEMDDGVLDQQNPTSEYPGTGEPASIIALNNTVIGASTHTFAFESDQLICKNNIVILLDDNGEVKYTDNIDFSQIDYNLYYVNNTTGNNIIGAQYTLSEWQQFGADLHSLNENPLLDADFKPTSDSPVIDAGADLSALGVTADITGLNRPQGSAYDIGAYEFDGTTSVNDGIILKPENYILGQNYPNPFNPSTTIRITIPKEGKVHLAVYDILGQKVKDLVNGFMKAGIYNFNFNAGNLTSGVYLYRLDSGSFTDIKKMILLK